MKQFIIKTGAVLPFILIAILLIAALSESKVYIDITSPASRKIPIAIAGFNLFSSSEKPSEAVVRETLDVLTGDLDFSGFFDILDINTEMDEESEFDPENVDFKRWMDAGSELLIKGGYSHHKEKDKLVIELRLYDVVKEELLIAKRYRGKRILLRQMVHRFSDQILKEITGEKGIFETKVAYVSTSSDNKEIYMADYDGHNPRQVTNNGSINLSPQWSPFGKWLLYTSFKEGEAYLYVRNLSDNRDFRISNHPGINIGARWAPSGNEIALTLSIDGNPELYIMDIGTGELKRLTKNRGIDVSPTWSHNGERLAFVSDIGGSPQIYAIDRNAKNLKRLTSKGKYHASPAWSPTQDKIVFSKLEGGRFNIWLMNSDGTQQVRLTFNSGDNEEPSWSPDGRYITFNSNRDGYPSVYIMRADGTGQRKITRGNDPSWSPFFRKGGTIQ
ncbi:MAG: Tol-Pal system beta propeller repeat protein TolB [Thermodesulfobacteriota bacterium]